MDAIILRFVAMESDNRFSIHIICNDATAAKKIVNMYYETMIFILSHVL